MLLNGIAIYNGYAFGKAFILKEENIIINNDNIDKNQIDNEINNFLKSYKKTLRQLKNIRNLSIKNKDRKLLFDGYILILKDKLFKKDIINLIKNKLLYADTAVNKFINKQIKLIKKVNNIYIKERANDLIDISKRLIYNIKNIELIDFNSLNNNKENIIIISEDLSPSQIVQFNLDIIKGFIIENGSITSHSSIISKSLELVSLIGVNNITNLIKNNDYVIIDGIKGNVYINPDKSIIKIFDKKYNKFISDKKNLLKLRNLNAITFDGYNIKLLANVGNNKDINNIFKYGAEGIGLYRTEFLFMDRNDFPNEEEQFFYYKEAVKLMKDNLVTIRTVDLGGDKFLSYMDFPKEDVPFLGWRSIRIYKDNKQILHTQLRAILRASFFGKIRILFPMIISMEEVYFLKSEIDYIKNNLIKENINFDENIKIGAMIETPSAAIICSHLAEELDFFSIGTNDLTQFVLAVDRNNLKVSYLYNPLCPSIINLIRYIVNTIHEKNKKVGICGELASNLNSIKLLLGLGLDELSMNVSFIPNVKKIIRSSYYSSCKKLLDKILDQKTNKDIEKILNKNLINN